MNRRALPRGSGLQSFVIVILVGSRQWSDVILRGLAPCIRSWALLFIAVLSIANAKAQSLERWLIAKIDADEQLLRDAFLGRNGRSLDLLKGARGYVPFFLEEPQGLQSLGLAEVTPFEDLKEEYRPSFLAGGYIYRIRVKDGLALYSTSAGDFDGGRWRNFESEQEVLIEPSQMWIPSTGKVVTLIAGRAPRLVEYGRDWKVSSERVFDVTKGGVEEDLAEIADKYDDFEKQVIEMISLMEYIASPKSLWRPVDLTGIFNLRNQQEREGEAERLRSIEQLERRAAVAALQSMTGTVELSSSRELGRPVVAGSSPKEENAANQFYREKTEGGEGWHLWIVGTLICLVGLFAVVKVIRR